MITRRIPDVGSYDTVLCADSVEWCPRMGFRDICVCSTYELDLSRGAKYGEAHFLSIPPPEAGNVRVPVYEAAPKVDFAGGVLDAKWGELGGVPVLAVGTSAGAVSVLSLTRKCSDGFVGTKRDHSVCINQLRNIRVLANNAVLSVDWAAGSNTELLTTNGNGTAAIFDLSISSESDKAHAVARWKAHDLYGAETEVWVGVFDKVASHTVYTGADDGKFKGWDTRSELKRPLFVNEETNGCGVCSINCSPHREFLVASGGYDGFVRIWDTRMMHRGSMQSINVGGGVWRLKWHPQISSKLAAAAMRGGAHILTVDCVPHKEGEYSCFLKSFDHYDGHPSEALTYGIDWSYDHAWNGNLVGTCSFYDHSLHFWRPGKGSAIFDKFDVWKAEKKNDLPLDKVPSPVDDEQEIEHSPTLTHRPTSLCHGSIPVEGDDSDVEYADDLSTTEPLFPLFDDCSSLSSDSSDS